MLGCKPVQCLQTKAYDDWVAQGARAKGNKPCVGPRKTRNTKQLGVFGFAIGPSPPPKKKGGFPCCPLKTAPNGGTNSKKTRPPFVHPKPPKTGPSSRPFAAYNGARKPNRAWTMGQPGPSSSSKTPAQLPPLMGYSGNRSTLKVQQVWQWKLRHFTNSAAKGRLVRLATCDVCGPGIAVLHCGFGTGVPELRSGINRPPAWEGLFVSHLYGCSPEANSSSVCPSRRRCPLEACVCVCFVGYPPVQKGLILGPGRR